MSKKSRRVSKARRVLFTLSLVLVMMMVAVGGTIAWLTDSTTEIKNTFAPTNIDIDLTEEKNNDGNPFDLVPGVEYAKDPIVSVVRPATDVDIYLFVKFEEIGTPSGYLTYTSTLTTDNGWDKVTENGNVWYRTVKADDTVISWHLLDGDKVTVKDLTKDQMPEAGTEVALKYTAYAIQTAGFEGDVAGAWAQASALAQ